MSPSVSPLSSVFCDLSIVCYYVAVAVTGLGLARSTKTPCQEDFLARRKNSESRCQHNKHRYRSVAEHSLDRGSKARLGWSRPPNRHMDSAGPNGTRLILNQAMWTKAKALSTSALGAFWPRLDKNVD